MFVHFKKNFYEGERFLIKVLAISGYKPFELGIFKKDHPSVFFIKAAIKKVFNSND